MSKKNETMKVTYPEFPTTTSELSIQYVIDYCKANAGEAAVRSFITTIENGKYITKNGKEMRYGSTQAVGLFARTFFPALESASKKKLPAWKKELFRISKEAC